jgi:emfourin
VIIKVERSGGFAGIPITYELDATDLPSAIIRTAKKIIEEKNVYSLSMKSSRKGTADQYTYKISIRDGESLSVIDCNEFEIQDDLKSLVKYVENNSKH